ncbi:hypothetical protein DCC79_04500 [bacterium]|nr:NYN domain-containing protein [Chloroflexi bacterium CFX6]RIL11569.1 MAG: hypothetical protein DCC79_04500 [bacterium]
MSSDRVAVFIDFENIAISAQGSYGECDFGAIMREAERWGNCIIRRAYADWTRFKGYSEDLIEHSVDLTQLFAYGGGRTRKNAVDIQLVVDVLETALLKPDIGTFVIVGGDSDYTAIARKLRAYGKKVVGIGLRQATSAVLVKACDHFVLYESIVGIDTGAASGRLDEARALLVEALKRRTARPGEEQVLAAALKHTMLSIDNTFDEVTLGFPQFKDFLQAQSDIVQIRVIDQQLWVRSKATPGATPADDQTAAYRAALRSAELRLFDGSRDLRTEVLQDLYHVLAEQPGTLTLNAAVLDLAAHYDAEQILRDRNQVRDVAKLVRYADVFEPVPGSFQLDRLTLRPGLDEQAFVDACESVYLGVFLESGLPVANDLLAQLLFGSLDAAPRIAHLAELAQARLRVADPAQNGAGWAWPARFRELPELRAVVEEVEACTLDEPASLDRAADLAARGHAVRPKSFEQARRHFLQAARVMLDLLRRGEPGASEMELETLIASYCFAAAGARYLSYDYTRSAQYYLAFFGLMRETRPVWDKMYGLLPPMLSYYLSTALRQAREPVASSPGYTHPANMAILVHEHPNPEVHQRWTDLVADLRRVNPTMVRLIIDRLEELEVEKGTPAAAETRDALAAVA